MGDIVTEKVAVTTTGEDGSATGTGYTGVISGFVLDVYLDYHASAPNTTDVTVAYADRGGNILAVANANTDGLFAPRQAELTNANAAAGGYVMFPVNGQVSVAVAGCNALTGAVTAYIRYLRS